MLVEELLERLETALKPLGAVVDVGEEFRDPPLDVLCYLRRPVRVSWVPWIGRALSVVAVVRQPFDVGLSGDGYVLLLRRLAMALNGRYPPTKGLTIGLTAVVLTPEPIGPEDDAVLARALSTSQLARMRAVPFGLFRLNLGQEAMAMALVRGPDNLFPEPETLADALTPLFQRFVPLIEG